MGEDPRARPGESSETRRATRALPPRGIILTHGDLGEELKRTAALILGSSGDLEALSNTGLSTSALAARLDALLADEPKERPIFLFVDILGGSCAQACPEQLKGHPGSRLITGVNLPMIIAFLQYRDSKGVDELAAGILMRGHRGITVFPPLDHDPAGEPSPGSGASR